MKLYIGVNRDGTCMVSKQPIKRFIDFKSNVEDVMSFKDTLQGPHWMLDYTGMNVPKGGDIPIDVYLTLPAGAIKRMFGVDMTWEDDFKIIEL